VSGFLTGMLIGQTAFASYAVPPENTGSGVIEYVNYANRTITVNGHIYMVSSKANYVSQAVRNMGGLQAGMKVQFIANGPVSNPTSQITSVVVLPSTPR
jgi:hypothetical protein